MPTLHASTNVSRTMGLTLGSVDTVMAPQGSPIQLSMWSWVSIFLIPPLSAVLTSCIDYKAGIEWIQAQIQADATGLTDDTRFWVEIQAI